MWSKGGEAEAWPAEIHMNTPNRTYKFTKTCQDCGDSFQTDAREARFCSTKCRKEYNNRRAVRGAEMYDLLMTMRFDRGLAKDEQLWTHVCNLAAAYRNSDKAKRAGRKSWDPQAFRDLPLAYSDEGDKR
jgi:hypothetical protein